MALSLANLLEREGGGSAFSARLAEQGLGFEEQRQTLAIISNPRASWNCIRGQMHATKGRYEQAIASFDRAIKADPNLGRAYTGRGAAFAKLGDIDRALKDCARGVEVGPEDPFVHLGYAELLANLGRIDEQIAVLRSANVVMRPIPATQVGAIVINLTLGEALRSVGRYDEAALAFQRLRSLEHSDLHGSLGALHQSQALVEGGRYEEAIEVADEILRHFPELGMPYVIRGAALGMLGRIEESLTVFKKGIELAVEQHADPVLAKATSYLMMVVNNQSISYNLYMSDAASALMAAAEHYGLPKDVVKAIGSLAADAERETTGRAPAKTRLDDADDDTRLGRLQRRYQKRLRQIVIPEGGSFTTEAQAKAGALLAQTLRDLQEVQEASGLPVTKTPERVRKAEAMASAYRRSHDKKTGEPIPPRPRGRPRRAHADSSPS